MWRISKQQHSKRVSGPFVGQARYREQSPALLHSDLPVVQRGVRRTSRMKMHWSCMHAHMQSIESLTQQASGTVNPEDRYYALHAAHVSGICPRCVIHVSEKLPTKTLEVDTNSREPRLRVGSDDNQARHSGPQQLKMNGPLIGTSGIVARRRWRQTSPYFRSTALHVSAAC